MNGRIGARCPAIGRQAVAQHRALEASLREPFRRFESFLVDDYALITAARNDEPETEGLPVGIAHIRKKKTNREDRDGDEPQP